MAYSFDQKTQISEFLPYVLPFIIFAGMIYSILLYQKKNLFSPILAHGVTNLLLGVYVIANNEWGFW